jgi:hypothetical protein
METTLQTENEELNELEGVNDLSEQAIKVEYLEAAIHGPRWILGLIDEAI